MPSSMNDIPEVLEDLQTPAVKSAAKFASMVESTQDLSLNPAILEVLDDELYTEYELNRVKYLAQIQSRDEELADPDISSNEFSSYYNFVNKQPS